MRRIRSPRLRGMTTNNRCPAGCPITAKRATGHRPLRVLDRAPAGAPGAGMTCLVDASLDVEPIWTGASRSVGPGRGWGQERGGPDGDQVPEGELRAPQ